MVVLAEKLDETPIKADKLATVADPSAIKVSSKPTEDAAQKDVEKAQKQKVNVTCHRFGLASRPLNFAVYPLFLEVDPKLL